MSTLKFQFSPHVPELLEADEAAQPELWHRRDVELEDYLANLAGGKEYATVVVAAVDSHASGKATADFVCDGVNDEVTLSEAASSMPLYFGIAPFGKVVLLEGNYTVEGPIVPTGSAITLQLVEWVGTGPLTVLSVPSANDGTFTLLANCGIWKGVTINGNGAGQSSGAMTLADSGTRFEDCSLVAGYEAPTLLALGAGLHVKRTSINAGSVASVPAVYGTAGVVGGIVEDCDITHNVGGIVISGGSVDDLRVVRGTITRSSGTPTGTVYEHIVLDSGSGQGQLVVDHTEFPNHEQPPSTIRKVGAGPALITGVNVLCSSESHQIVVDGGDGGLISGNTITGAGSGGPDNSADSIHLTGGANHNTIVGNQLGFRSSAGERSAIYLDATTLDNYAIGALNNLSGSNTADVIDLGTINITQFPSSAVDLTDVLSGVPAAALTFMDSPRQGEPGPAGATGAAADESLIWMQSAVPGPPGPTGPAGSGGSGDETLLWMQPVPAPAPGPTWPPTYVPPSTCFTVPADTQVLFSLPIVVDGSLDILGALVEVS